MNASSILTMGDLKRVTGEPYHVVNHAVNRFGPQPRARIGIHRIWDSSDLPAIRDSLDRTAERSTNLSRRKARRK